MSVVIETTLGDLTVDLYLSERPRACQNFLKLCKIKYYNYNLFHTISRGFIAQTGDPTGSGSGGESIYGVLHGTGKRYFEAENEPRIKHTRMGLISFVGNEERMIGSQFFITLGDDLSYLDERHCVFGEVVEGSDILDVINEAICDTDDRPYQDVRITHTVILDDPFPDPAKLDMPSRSPSPSVERLQGGRIAPDEEIDEMEGKTNKEIAEMQAEREAKARATILEMVGDIPDADVAPPENVLFVCKLNPVTTDEDLEIIFNRFGKIKSCEVIKDKKTGDSLQYAFIEFEEEKSCEDAYFKMDNILIDDRRIHVDFSQSVSKIKWHGKGRGVTHYDEKGISIIDGNNDIGKGNYKPVHLNKPKSLKKSEQSLSPKTNSRQYNVRSPSRSPAVERRRNRTPPKTERNNSRHRHSDSYSRRERERSRTPSKSGRYEARISYKKRESSSSPRNKHSYERKSRSHSPKRDQYRLSSRKKQSESPEKYRSYSRNKSPRNYRDYVSEYSSSRRAENKSSGFQRDNSDQNDKNRSYSQYHSKRNKSRSPSYKSKYGNPETKNKGVSSREEGEKHARGQVIHDNKEYKKYRSNLKDAEKKKNSADELDSEDKKKNKDKKTKSTLEERKHKKRSKHRDSSDSENEKNFSSDEKPKKKKKSRYSSSESSSESSPVDRKLQRNKEKRTKSISKSSSETSEDRKENDPRKNIKETKERSKNKLKISDDSKRKLKKTSRTKKETSSSSSSSSSSSTTSSSSSSPSSTSSSDSDESIVIMKSKGKKKQK